MNEGGVARNETKKGNRTVEACFQYSNTWIIVIYPYGLEQLFLNYKQLKFING